GDRLAFTSKRTNTSQVYVIVRAGGQAAQLTHESTGAFDPSWSDDGTLVLYSSLAGPPTIMAVPAAGGDAKVFAADERGLGEVACGPSSCVAVVDPLGTASGLVVVGANGDRRSITA